MASKDPNSLANDRSLSQHLKAKSRRRREGQARLAAPSAAARLPRNDVLPELMLIDILLDELRLPGRKVRGSDPAHVREVAGSISALGFCVPVLIGTDNLVLDGAIRVEAARLLASPACRVCGSINCRRSSSARCGSPPTDSARKASGTLMN